MKQFILMSLFIFTVSGELASADVACPTDIIGSCIVESGCIDAVQGMPLADFQKTCQDEEGTFSGSACATENRVGSCLVNKDQQQRVVLRFYQPTPGNYVPMICQSAQGQICK